MKRRHIMLGVALVAALGCSGKILGGKGHAGGSGPNGATCTDDAPASGLIRMNATQLQNTEQDLFAAPSLTLALDAKDAIASPTITALEVADINAAAEQLVATGGHHRFAPCSVSGTFDDGCATAFIQAFGLRAFRRPLTSDELSWLQGVYQNVKGLTGITPAATFQDAVDMVAEVMIQSPQHLYISAQGVDDSSLPAGLKRTTGYERATRLSYFLTNSTPPDDLLTLAGQGGLDAEDGVRSAASSLLDSPRGHEVVKAFAGDYGGLGGDPLIPVFEAVPKDAAKFPMDNAALRTAMRGELESFYEHVFYDEGGSFPKLMTSTEAYVNGPLASLYGLQGSPTDAATFQWMNLDPTQRAGLFTRVAFLAEEANQEFESPIHRGVTLFKYVLCQPLGPPPPNANSNQPPLAGSSDGGTALSVRQQTDVRTAAAQCQACHAQFNPIGYSFDRYDAMGRWQTADQGTDASGKAFSIPVDATATIPGTDLAGTVSGAVQLSQKLSQSQEALGCMASTWLTHATGRPLVQQDQCALTKVQGSFAQSGDMHALVLDVAASAPTLYVRSAP